MVNPGDLWPLALRDKTDDSGQGLCCPRTHSSVVCC